MFVRARPTIDKAFILNLLKAKGKLNSQSFNNLLFFNSGKGALKWFLQNISTKSLKVGVQAFTCVTVVDAINEANHSVVLLDTNEKYFTTLMTDLKGHEDIDVLVLTHLFGIPNPDYREIKQWATQNNIIIINDLAQTVRGELNGQLLEDLSEYYFYSFSFDKPLSAGSGAILKIDDVDVFNLKAKYRGLKKQSEKAGKRELKKLIFYYELTSDKYYTKEFRTNSFIEKLLFFIFPANTKQFSILCYILSSKLILLISKVELGLKRRLKSKITPRQLSDKMILYIQHILENVNISHYEAVVYAKSKLKEIENDIVFLSDGNIKIAYGQRFPVLSENPKDLIEKLNLMGIESGNYNWPNLVTDDTQNYPNSLMIVNKIVNIPIWSSKIWEKIN